jgi:hypothetical protein
MKSKNNLGHYLQYMKNKLVCPHLHPRLIWPWPLVYYIDKLRALPANIRPRRGLNTLHDQDTLAYLHLRKSFIILAIISISKYAIIYAKNVNYGRKKFYDTGPCKNKGVADINLWVPQPVRVNLIKPFTTAIVAKS